MGMRSIALLILGACAGQQPLLANAPHPSSAAMAGGFAAAAAAITLASPGYSVVKPEQKAPAQPIDVHEQVTPDVLDRLDHNDPSGVANGTTGAASATGESDGAKKAAPAAKKRSGPPPRVPLPSDAIHPTDDTP
jgi:hypothetical protein